MHPYVNTNAELAKMRHADRLRGAEQAQLARSVRVARPSQVEKLRALFPHRGIPRLASKPRVQPS
jgi:hypothetical protein